MRRPRAVAAVDDRDLQGGQLQAWIEGREARVVPARDPPEVDVRKRLPVQDERAARDTRQIHRRHDRARHHVELLQPGRLARGRVERRVRSREVDRPRLDLADARRGADGLVVHLRARPLLGVGIRPRLVERRREASARAVQLDPLGGPRRPRRRAQGNRHGRLSDLDLVHVRFPFLVCFPFYRQCVFLRPLEGTRWRAPLPPLDNPR